ncbi:hypothetical protein LTR24_003582 [Lithohypha guttulata]|uniref:Uncharacterized protein n=1 Tax=Lithohypha guttulata TaxID=1690604 RepID=A0ABR0KGD0_9EURO|nr:hypothetical protein LTR24_003582 [Lithohypha guttulata]
MPAAAKRARNPGPRRLIHGYDRTDACVARVVCMVVALTIAAKKESTEKRIWDEERTFAQKLHDDCDKFSAAVNTDHRAREEAKAHRVRLYEVETSPLRWVDPKTNTIPVEYGPFNLYSGLKEQSSIKYHVDDYLEALKACPGYLAEHIGASFDAEQWAKKRQSLALRLLKEATRLREAPAEERDCEMRIE